MYSNSKVTLELRELLENGVDLWAFDYPSYYKGDDKKDFEQKVIDHYYFRQIGQETTARFLHYFRAKIREIMPLYIQRYKSVEIMDAIEDPFATTDVIETFEQTTSGNSNATVTSRSNATSTHTANGQTKVLNTPQGQIELLNDGYMTSAEQNNGNNSTTDNGETTTTNSNTDGGTLSYTHTKKGSQGVTTYAHDMTELRQTFINVDMEIIEELNCLFLGVY